VKREKTRLRLSEHFVIEEFDCRDGTWVPAGNEGAILHLVTWWLQPMREKFGPIHVVSGFRTPRHNVSVGGARHSVHLLRTPLPARAATSTTVGAAADVVARSSSSRAIAAWARRHRGRNEHLAEHGRGGVGEYAEAGFVHVDTGPLRDWRG
jgi:uncharacterized protein YcbK (DUF882 family)